MVRSVCLAACVAMTAGIFLWSAGKAVTAEESAFTKAFLDDPANIAIGKKVWKKRCKFCHGKKAYPGKGPPLKPDTYKPEFVYKRVTKGFRGMPALKKRFSEEQLRGVVAYVMSKEFLK